MPDKGNPVILHGICFAGWDAYNLILRRKIPLLLHGQSHFPSENEEEYYLNKARLIVTRVFDSQRTPQEAFVRAILNSDKYAALTLKNFS